MLFGLRIIEREQSQYPLLAVDQREPVFPRHNPLAVDFLQNHARNDLGSGNRERPGLQDFIHFKPVSVIIHIEKQTEGRRRLLCTGTAVSRPRMRNIQLAQNLGKHLGEVIIVVYMGKERFVFLLQTVQIHSVIVRTIEFPLLLPEHMLKHVRTLPGPVKIHVHIEINRFQLFVTQRHDLRTAAEYIEFLSVLVQTHPPGRDPFPDL